MAKAKQQPDITVKQLADIEVELNLIMQGLEALRDLALKHQPAERGDPVPVCVEYVAEQLLGKVRRSLDLLDSTAEVSHA